MHQRDKAKLQNKKSGTKVVNEHVETMVFEFGFYYEAAVGIVELCYLMIINLWHVM